MISVSNSSRKVKPYGEFWEFASLLYLYLLKWHYRHVMNLSTLIKQYFSSKNEDLTIDVFDEKNIYDVYQRVVGVLTQYIEIETTVLQAVSYCFYEILDNVLIHSGKELGTVITHYDSSNHVLSFLVADDGIGVRESLSENEQYSEISESEALRICVKDAITDGKGMGFGLYSTSLLARDAGLRFEVRSGGHALTLQGGDEEISESEFWQGTIIYLQIQTNKEINPAEVVANRTNVAAQYNETFLNDNELEELW